MIRLEKCTNEHIIYELSTVIKRFAVSQSLYQAESNLYLTAEVI